MAPNNKKFFLSCFISQETYIIIMIFIYGTHVQKDNIYRSFFHFFKILIFWVASGVKGQKMAWGDKKSCLWHSTIWGSIHYDPDFWYTCVKWRHPEVLFFILSKFWFCGLLGGWKGKKWPQMTKNIALLTQYLSNHTSCDSDFWHTYVKWWYLQVFLFIF